MSAKLEYRLREWGNFIADNDQYANELGENILYGGGRIQDGSWAGSKILCPDHHKNYRKVQEVSIAVNRLPEYQKRCVTEWYCATLRDDGQPKTMGQIALGLRTTANGLQKQINKAKKSLKISLL